MPLTIYFIYCSTIRSLLEGKVYNHFAFKKTNFANMLKSNQGIQALIGIQKNEIREYG